MRGIKIISNLGGDDISKSYVGLEVEELSRPDLGDKKLMRGGSNNYQVMDTE